MEGTRMTTPALTSNGLGTSMVRTLVPILIGPVIARFCPGLDPKDPNVLLMVSAVASYLYYVVVRVLELKAPKLGYLLGIAKAPAYSPKESPSPGAGEEVVAVVVPTTTDEAAAQPEQPAAEPEQTDNTERPEDGPQDVSQDPTVLP
jgi:hypothetical protein